MHPYLRRASGDIAPFLAGVPYARPPGRVVVNRRGSYSASREIFPKIRATKSLDSRKLVRECARTLGKRQKNNRYDPGKQAGRQGGKGGRREKCSSLEVRYRLRRQIGTGKNTHFYTVKMCYLTSRAVPAFSFRCSLFLRGYAAAATLTEL